MPVTLRPYQQRLLTEVAGSIAMTQKARLQAFVGASKTFVSLSAAAAFHAKNV